VSWSTPDGSGVIHHKDAHGFCKKMFEGESVWANGPFDWAVICKRYPDLVPLVFDAIDQDRVYDVLLRQKLIDIAYGRLYGFGRDANGENIKFMYSVAALAQRHCGIKLDKSGDTFRLRYMEFYDVPVEQWPDAAVEYARKDSEILVPIFDIQQEEGEVLVDQFRQSKANMALHLASAWGIRTDRDAVQKLDDWTREEFEEVRERLKDCGLIHKKGSRNTKAAKALLIELVGDKEQIKLTDTGLKKLAMGASHEEMVDAGYVKLDEESCEATGDKRLIDYARFGALLKLRSTYVEAMWQGVDLPIQTYFDVLKETGRTSSVKPNLQNLPRAPGVRECVVARPGYVFIFSDYDKAELCSLAQTCIEVCGYSRLADRLNAGFDPHLDMGAQILGVSYEEALARKKAGDKEIKTFRQMAKAANFGLPGGLGPDTFIQYAKGSYGVEITREQAVHLKQKWFETWPEMRQYFEWVNSMMDGSGRAWIVHPMSRRCRGNISYTVCCNSFFQGRSADGAKAAGWEMTRRQFTEPKSALYGTHIALFIHDEYAIEAPEEYAHEAAMEMEQVMVEQFTKFHPDLAKAVGASPSMSRRWYKEVPQVWKGGKPYEGGRLIPWEDRDDSCILVG
jgi:DNA polymerase-1